MKHFLLLLSTKATYVNWTIIALSSECLVYKQYIYNNLYVLSKQELAKSVTSEKIKIKVNYIAFTTK